MGSGHVRVDVELWRKESDKEVNELVNGQEVCRVRRGEGKATSLLSAVLWPCAFDLPLLALLIPTQANNHTTLTITGTNTTTRSKTRQASFHTQCESPASSSSEYLHFLPPTTTLSTPTHPPPTTLHPQTQAQIPQRTPTAGHGRARPRAPYPHHGQHLAGAAFLEKPHGRARHRGQGRHS